VFLVLQRQTQKGYLLGILLMVEEPNGLDATFDKSTI